MFKCFFVWGWGSCYSILSAFELALLVCFVDFVVKLFVFLFFFSYILCWQIKLNLNNS